VVDFQTMESGLRCCDRKVGAGRPILDGDVVRVHYEGRLEGWEGPVFDSSYRRHEPLEFKVGGGAVIKGWEAGIIGMAVTGRRMLEIPPALGYGAAGVKDKNANRYFIPPNATLYFKVELVGAGERNIVLRMLSQIGWGGAVMTEGDDRR
jgi:FKBP-type peptidyl-prolyl cis-trans isomerase